MAPNPDTPGRLEPDAILEALVEVRFESPDLPEVVVGRLTDAAHWSTYQQSRLPVADVPQTIRESDLDFRYQPIIELRRPDGLRAARIGGRVVSYHVTNSYPGWAVFQHEIQEVLADITMKIRGINFIRIGVRYINAFTADRHFISGVGDTKLSMELDGSRILGSFNLNYKREHEKHVVMVRLATPDLIAGAIPPGVSLLCDIDINTSGAYLPGSLAAAMAWVEEAHDMEKEEFFRLLPEKTIYRLTSGNSSEALQ